MAPLILTPPEPVRNTVIELNETVAPKPTPESAPGVVKASGSGFYAVAVEVCTGDDGLEEIESTFPGGVDYAKWEKGVTAAPREAFADRLDLLDFDE